MLMFGVNGPLHVNITIRTALNPILNGTKTVTLAVRVNEALYVHELQFTNILVHSVCIM